MIVMITSTLPFSNYSSLLIKSYSNLDADKLIVYSEKSSNSQVKGPLTVKPIWEKGLKFYPTVIKELIKDKPDIVHIQFEINMFGTIISNLFFPLFLMFLKLCKFKLIFTMHSVIKLKTINSEFIKLFRGDGSRIPPIFLKIYFFGFNLIVNTLCDLVIVHTNLLKKWLVSDYKFNQNKIIVIPMGVPNFYIRPKNKDSNYFFYFGYFARRKGIEEMLKGFSEYTKQDDRFYLFMAGGVIPGQEFAFEEIKNLIQKLKLDRRVKIIGYLKGNDEFDKYFTDAYCCVVPATISISASGPLSKAFGYHKCIIASDIGNFSEEINHKVDGYLTKNSEWKDAFEYIASNPQLVKKIEEGAALKAKKRSWDNAAKIHKDIYSKLS